MAAALLLSNLALLVDAGSPRVAIAADRAGGGKSWHAELSMSRPSRREPAAAAHAVAFHDPVDSGGDPAAAAPRAAYRRRRGAGAKVGAAGPGGIGGNGEEEDDDDDEDWEEGIRRRLKEIEDMKELENRAAELVAEGAGGDEEETEEEKRERVRRELEKVAKEQAERRNTAKLMFELGQKAYGKGMYSRAIEFLEAALTIIAKPTLLGGEVLKGSGT